MKYYYHAGADRGAGHSVQVYWSCKTRRSQAAAEKEARELARLHGGKPVVEYWSHEHGLRPGWDCVAGSYDVET